MPFLARYFPSLFLAIMASRSRHIGKTHVPKLLAEVV